MSRGQVGEYQHPITFSSSGDPSKDFRFAFESYEADLADLLPKNSNASVLDVGCGWGQCLMWLKSKGFDNLTGIDVGEQQELAGRELGLDVRRVDDPVTFLNSQADSFDLVVMNHVIEHMNWSQGVETLRAIRTALKTDGRIIVQTPNMNCVGAHAGRYIELSHVTGYTESSLDQIVRMAGFGGVELFGSRTPFSFKPRRLAWKTLQLTSRTIWRLMLLGELGTDQPGILSKNLYATGVKVTDKV